MKTILHRSLFLIVCMLALANVQASHHEDKQQLTADGPYIIHSIDGSTRVVEVDVEGNIRDTTYATLPDDYSFEVVSHDGRHRFTVSLHHVERPQWQYEMSGKVFVMSDPHGDLDCVISLLRGNGIIDGNYRWTYGTNRLVVIGDVMDRGKDATQIFWLLYKLEKEAEEAGGSLHFLLGNHEPMVLMNDLRYTKDKYKLLAERLQMEYPDLMSRASELGHWIATRNTMETIGRNLFVHAGISRDLLDLNLSIPTVNEQMSHGLWLNKSQRRADCPLTWFLFSSQGPIWYRGMVRNDDRYRPISPDTLSMVLRRYDVDHVIVGHTIFDEVTAFHSGKVIAVNVDNRKNRKKKKSRALLIENTTYCYVNDEGKPIHASR